MPQRYITQLNRTTIAEGPRKGYRCYVWNTKEESVPSFREQLKGLATSLQAIRANDRLLRPRHAH